MRKVTVMEYLTLDGVLESPEKWQFPYFSADVAEFVMAQLQALDAMLLGRVTYQIFAASWPHAPAEDPIAKKLNSMPKFVISSTLEKVEWNNSTLIKKNVVEEISKLKQKSIGDIGIPGSALLIQSLMQYELIDEYRLLVYPVVVGKGERLFKSGSSTPLKLAETRTFSSGVVLLSYQPERK